VTTVPVHASEDIVPGLLRRIDRDLGQFLGKGWLKKS
jgi:predicted RNA binding protein YcfA (HicA-like mRNA interferase family)